MVVLYIEVRKHFSYRFGAKNDGSSMLFIYNTFLM